MNYKDVTDLASCRKGVKSLNSLIEEYVANFDSSVSEEDLQSVSEGYMKETWKLRGIAIRGEYMDDESVVQVFDELAEVLEAFKKLRKG